MDILFLMVGLLVGALVGYLLSAKRNQSTPAIPEGFVRQELVAQSERIQAELKEKTSLQEAEILSLTREKANLESAVHNLKERLGEQKDEFEKLNERFKNEFQVLANQILEDKSKKFVELNHEQMGHLLNPLKEKITAFEKQVAEVYNKETREKAMLKVELDKIVEMNRKMSEDANRLTNALKGESKTQGDWGEMQLELILERAGLHKGLHFETQNNFKNEDGRNVRPDYLIKLPEGKHLILDAKVSLTAYERYYNAEDPMEKATHLKEHVQSILNHISGLSAKNYQNLEIAQPDYVMLFVPIEPALSLALRENPSLFDKALEKNIVLVSTSTLLATLRTIAFIWTQDNQQKNVIEIAKEGGALYDKFHGFVEDLKTVGNRLKGAKDEYDKAMNKLVDGRGNIVRRVENLKKLGAKATKEMDVKILERSFEE